jgi:hypothetical protein
MTADEFRQLVAATKDADLLGPCLRDAVLPWVFEPKPVSWTSFRADLTAEFNIDADDIAIVGSGRFGFSLKPGNNLRAFHDRSDIDVVIVSADLFDRLWYDLLKAVYPRPPATQREGGWLKDRKNELYTGWLSPLEVKRDATIYGPRVSPLLEFSARWFNTFKNASRHAIRRHEDITSRLYRTWQHAELYHLHSIAALRTVLTA